MFLDMNPEPGAEEQRVHAIPMDGCVLVEPIDWTKSTAAERIFNNLKKRTGPDETHKSPVDFLMVVGDGRDDEVVGVKYVQT